MRRLFPSSSRSGRSPAGWVALFACLVVGGHGTSATAQGANDAWRGDWAIEQGFGLEIDSEGFDLPTSIAVVPNPGPGPGAPLYFVTEMNGTIKVVTRDRSVHVFARDFFSLTPIIKQPWNFQEVGLAGVCLAPAQGYVFATFAYTDASGVLRNNMVRFDTTPGTFAVMPSRQTSFTSVFSGFESAPSHQIGPCHVVGDRVYVGVGDGQQPQRASDLQSIQGKILRLTLDGTAPPDNPHYRADQPNATAGYVWARGLRNPFGLRAHEGRIFVADNGPNVDRLLEIEAGRDYLWNGTDWSIGAAAAAVVAPAIGPAQMDVRDSGPFAEGASLRLFVAASGNLVWTENPAAQQRPGILAADYLPAERRIGGVPGYFLRYMGSGRQMVVGVAFSGDDLLILPLYAVSNGRSVVLRAEHRPESPHPFTLSSTVDAYTLFDQKGCIGCHRIGESGGTVGPALGSELSALFERLTAPEYAASVAAVDRMTEEPFVSWKTQRQQVMAASGSDRVKLWLKYRIQQPRFDSPTATMPMLAISESEADTMAAALLLMAGTPPVTTESRGWIERATTVASEWIGPLRYRHVVLSFLAGLGSALVLVVWGRRRARRR